HRRTADRRGHIDHGQCLGHEPTLRAALTYVEKVAHTRPRKFFDIYLTTGRPPMSRIQLALDVDDLDTAVAFYTTLFGTEPAKRKPGYANFAISDPPLKLVLIENAGRGGRLNHL